MFIKILHELIYLKFSQTKNACCNYKDYEKQTYLLPLTYETT